MRTQDQSTGRRPRRGPRRHRHGGGYNSNHAGPKTPPAPKTLWEKIKSLFTGNGKPKSEGTVRNGNAREGTRRPERKPELVAVSSPKVYVGNLSFDATESDLADLFNGVGQVQNAEIVSHKYTQKSKGFAFVMMASIEEAKRAVEVLHDKEFMGRKLVVSGAKTNDARSAG